MRLTLVGAIYVFPEPLLLFAASSFACVVPLSLAALWLFLRQRYAGSLPRPLMRVSLWGVPALAVVYLFSSIGLLLLYLSYVLDPQYQPGFFWVDRAGDLYDQIQFFRGCTVGAMIVAGVVTVAAFVVGLVAARPAKRVRVG